MLLVAYAVPLASNPAFSRKGLVHAVHALFQVSDWSMGEDDKLAHAKNSALIWIMPG